MTQYLLCLSVFAFIIRTAFCWVEDTQQSLTKTTTRTIRQPFNNWVQFNQRFFRPEPSFRSRCMRHIRYRTFNGQCNNLYRPTWGAARTPMLLLSSPVSHRRGQLKNARAISNAICSEPFSRPNRRRMSELVTFFGQFLDHTITETDNSRTEWPIKIPANDPVFRGRGFIPLFRTVKLRAIFGKHRAPMNKLTSYIDASSIYGSDASTAQVLREGKGGRVRMVNHFLKRDAAGFFISGDDRVNENSALTALHTLFAREHNRLAGEVSRAYPRASDYYIYQLTRHIVAAEMQAIVYYEFLPAVLGFHLPSYRGYNSRVVAAATSEFTTVAFRVGHTMVNSFVTSISNGRIRRRRLSSAFFNPKSFIEDGMDGLFCGMIRTRAAEIDNGVVSELRDLLTSSSSPIKLDLVALNIQRGRDHGIPQYNSLRKAFLLPPVTRFSQITRDKVRQRRLQRMYGSVDKIDAWIGGVCEDHAHGSLGHLFARIWYDQFTRLRDGDRHYFERPGVFNQYQIRKIPTLNRLIGSRRGLGKVMRHLIILNTGLNSNEVQRNPFFTTR